MGDKGSTRDDREAGASASDALAELARCLTEVAANAEGADARVAAHLDDLLRSCLRQQLNERLRAALPTTAADTGTLVQDLWQQLGTGAGMPSAGADAPPVATAAGGARWSAYIEPASLVMQELAQAWIERTAASAPADAQAADSPSPQVMQPLSAMNALRTLETLAPALARVVRLRWFGGLDVSDIGRLTGDAEPQVQRRWLEARAFMAAAGSR